MKLKEFLEKTKITQTEFAKKIQSTATEVSTWCSLKRPVPVARCVKIEQATNGEVTRKDLRPDDWFDIWPELAEK